MYLFVCLLLFVHGLFVVVNIHTNKKPTNLGRFVWTGEKKANGDMYPTKTHTHYYYYLKKGSLLYLF